MRAAGDLGALPHVVLTHAIHSSDDEVEEAIWQAHQAKLANLSSRGSLIVAEGSGHIIQVERPDLVIQAILDGLKEAE